MTEHINRYIWSSFVTFSTFFIAALALVIKDLSWDGLMSAAGVSTGIVILRLIGKALFEATKAYIIYLASKLKK